MSVVIILIIIFCVVFVPQLWVRHVIKKYGRTIDALPGTGGELAQHFLKRFGLNDITIEHTDNSNDHYDLDAMKIRLSEQNYNGKSLTAVVIAAHEFGHALQHHTHYKPLLLRHKLAKIAAVAEKIAAYILLVVPFMVVLVKLPVVSLGALLAGLTIMCLPVVLHLFTLPVEFDASFNRALPLLKKGGYLPKSAMPMARRILTAAALTYVSASLASLLNFYRWLMIIRR